MAEYLFPANVGWFTGSQEELEEFCMKTQKETLTGKGLVLMHPAIVSYDPNWTEDEERMREFLESQSIQESTDDNKRSGSGDEEDDEILELFRNSKKYHQ